MPCKSCNFVYFSDAFGAHPHVQRVIRWFLPRLHDIMVFRGYDIQMPKKSRIKSFVCLCSLLMDRRSIVVLKELKVGLSDWEFLVVLITILFKQTFLNWCLLSVICLVNVELCFSKENGCYVNVYLLSDIVMDVRLFRWQGCLAGNILDFYGKNGRSFVCVSL